MPGILRTFLFWTLILHACVPDFPSSVAAPPTPLPTAQSPTVVPVATTVAPSNPADCTYQWAYQDIPELSNDFLASIRELQAEAQANAFIFGENCIRADGSSTFLSMETDFNVTLQVSDLSDDADLGEWIVKVMRIIDAIPSDRISGLRPGRVSIIFQSSGEQKGINFYLDQYRTLPSGLSSAEIYHTFQTSQ
jgi:hypothetical protein